MLQVQEYLRDTRFADNFAALEVLEAELSLPRERHMAAHIRRWRKEVKGPIVVVTGGFLSISRVAHRFLGEDVSALSVDWSGPVYDAEGPFGPAFDPSEQRARFLVRIGAAAAEKAEAQIGIGRQHRARARQGVIVGDLDVARLLDPDLRDA